MKLPDLQQQAGTAMGTVSCIRLRHRMNVDFPAPRRADDGGHGMGRHREAIPFRKRASPNHVLRPLT
jgi:hypothetical protein